MKLEPNPIDRSRIMMASRWTLALVALLVLAACGKSDDKAAAKSGDATAGVTLSSEEIKGLGIATQPALTAQYRSQITGFGTVVALDTIAQTDADFMTARAAAAQSTAAASRVRALATGEEAAVSREIVESAESKSAADQAALALARRKAEATFGRQSPWRDERSRQSVMAALASGKVVLVRVTFPLGQDSQPPRTLVIARLGAGAKSWPAKDIWEAPADPNLPGRGFYALVAGSDLAQNEHVSAMVPIGAAQQGVTIPASALVYGESESWVYVQTKPGTFLRTKVTTDKPMGDGYFVANGGGIGPGQAIVTGGAGLLLSRETNPSTEAGD
jgi:hypothetical protein